MARQRLVVTPPAQIDLDAITNFLSDSRSPEVAIRFLDEFYRKLDLIESQPEMGKPSATVSGVRRVLAGKYHAVYYEDIGEVILVLRVFDTRSNPDENPY